MNCVIAKTLKHKTEYYAVPFVYVLLNIDKCKMQTLEAFDLLLKT